MKTAEEFLSSSYCGITSFGRFAMKHAYESGQKQARKDEREKVVAEIKEMTIDQITDAQSICNAILGTKDGR
jgi:hypothetical protein